ncbi:MAG TPA: SIMPL domain-containing protein, partial [Gammaproteobacteria bacterium]|nr:SIMPL domain-containing protein [Gammaproteobacteria bacterium]
MSHAWNTVLLLGLSALAAGTAAQRAHGQESVVYDQISLSASAEREIDNDELVAVVYAQAQAERQVEAADQVNGDIRWALERAQSTRGISAQTLQYNSFPVYSDNRRIIAWQARQSLRLQSTDSDRLSELVGELQSRVAVESISYQVSRDARAAADDELIAAALATFNRRAALVAEELGRPGYRIVRLDINTGGAGPAPIAFRNRGL